MVSTVLPASPSVDVPQAVSEPSQSGVLGYIKELGNGNLYFSAGFGLIGKQLQSAITIKVTLIHVQGVGVGLTVLLRSVTLLTTLAQRRLLVFLEIRIQDHSHAWFLEWMAHQSKSRASTGVRIHSHQLAVKTTKFSLVPAPGTHWFRYQGAWIQVKREREGELLDPNSRVPWETVTLTTLARDRALFLTLLAEARDFALRGNEGRAVVYIARGIEWLIERVESDVRAFMGRGKWYAERGIPYRRGYLLHGPPGSGKSSFIQALAGSLAYNICILNISERGLTDDKLNYLLAHVPERSLILLEDIDAAFNRRVQTSEDGYQSGVTFSGLLNALDGVTSGEERIVYMSTNHLSRLDPALVRPGRVDLIQLLDDARPEQAEKLFARFYGRSDDGSKGPEKVSNHGGDGQVRHVDDRQVANMVDWQDDRQNVDITAQAAEVKRIVEAEITGGRRASMAALQGHFTFARGGGGCPHAEGMFFS